MSESKTVYPTWRYHKTETAVIVQDEAEDKALGKGWSDHPAEPKEEVETTTVSKMSKLLKDKKD